MKSIRLIFMAMAAVALSLASCSDGEDGTNGVNGRGGIDGANGADGQDGIDGQDGRGSEFTKYGDISLNLEGTRADGIPFQDSALFKCMFVGADPYNIEYSNTVHTFTHLVGNKPVHRFRVARFLSVPDDWYQENLMYFDLSVAHLGGDEQEVLSFEYLIHQYAVIGDDSKYFVIDHSYDHNDLSDLNIDGLVFDETKDNRLTFSYSFSLPGNYNETGHELHISGNVDVKLFTSTAE
ncbi:hypothetical protein [Flagellimonas baculiformis]|uniref:hypothetical protein n=1 Tax=Flagellimonas baculiformis TaxID=3067310 RepID=UPI00296EE326|nr:hypothetical protein [Muricauda sp. D6]